MKRISFVVAALVSFFAGVSCQKEEITNLSQETGVVPFILNASIPETKTTMDETWSVEWVDGDVIYAVTTDAEWGVAYAEDNGGESIADFTCEGDSFTTTKTISEGEHTFNFLYTRKNQRSYHRGASTTIVLPNTQNIDLDSPRDSIHLYDALAGQYTATVGTSVSVATVSMKHLFSMMKVTLNNQSGASIDVKSFEFRVPGKDVTGIFNIAFSADNAHVASTATKYSDAVKVSVSKNGTIAAGASKDVYFVLPPISGFTGDVEMKVTTADEKTFTRTISVSDLSFTAGKYTTGSYKLSKPDPEPVYTLSFEKLTSGDNISSYATAHTYKSGLINWDIVGNQSVGDNVRIGGKNTTATDRTVTSTNPMPAIIDKVVLNHSGIGNGKSSSMSVNSLSLRVSATSSFNSIIETVTIDGPDVTYPGVVEFRPNSSAWPSGCYYQLLVNYQISGSNNCYLVVDNLKFYGEASELPKSVLSSITVSGQKSSFILGESFDFGGVVTASYSDGTNSDVTSKATFAGYDMGVSGNQTVTVTYREGEIEKTTTYSINVEEQSVIFRYDGGKSGILTSDGISQVGLGPDYTSDPKLKFDSTGDYVLVSFDAVPAFLEYSIKGNSFSGGQFDVLQSADGSEYTSVATYTSLDSTTQNESFKLLSTTRYIKFIYTEKAAGNVALGLIMISK